MKKTKQITHSPPLVSTSLYTFVYNGAFVRAFVVLLLCSLFLQTVHVAFANEVPPDESPASLPVVTDEAIEVIKDEVEERTATTEESLSAVDPDEVIRSTEAEAEVTSEDPVFVDSSATNESSSEEQVGGAADVVGTPLESSADSLDGDVVEDETPALAGDSSVVEATTTASTTVDRTTPTLTVESDQMIQFNKNNCVSVEDGSYYCQPATTTVVSREQGMVALPDADGDLEIYIKDGENFIQITNNTIDDASPYYDAASDSIVWHRMVDERYQIVVYDVASKVETQLTDTTTNNMEPYRADNIIVWQHWDNDAWQIMMYDGTDIKQLTATVEHNLAPVVRNNLIVWHRVMYGEKTVEIYDISTGSYMTIRDDAGGTISNPRMVLVYDAAMDSGEVVTRGYDLITGEITSFATEPQSLPEEIPEPDTMGEERALVGTKTEQEDADEDMSDGDYLSSGTVGTSTVSDLGDTGSHVLDLRVDLVADVAAASTTIPDLIIPPLEATTSPTVIPVVE